MEEFSYNIIVSDLGFGFELCHQGSVFQRQTQGSNSEIWTHEEAEAVAKIHLDYWKQQF